MYRLILELPFDITVFWYKIFSNLEEAKREVETLPYGFLVIDESNLEGKLKNKLVIVLPFDKEVEGDPKLLQSTNASTKNLW